MKFVRASEIVASPLAAEPSPSLEGRDVRYEAVVRFFGFVEFDRHTACWLWKGKLDRGGYGRISVGGRKRKAHRFSFETFVRKLEASAVVDHRCRNRNCVNPAHLEPLTSRQNTIRGIAARKAEGTLPLPFGSSYEAKR